VFVAGEILLLEESVSLLVLIRLLAIVSLLAQQLVDVIGNQITDGVKKSNLPNVGTQLLAIMKPHAVRQRGVDGKILGGAVQKRDLMQDPWLVEGELEVHLDQNVINMITTKQHVQILP
jgi:hypothetical protein